MTYEKCNSVTYKEKKHKFYIIISYCIFDNILIYALSESDEKIRGYFQCEKLLRLFKANCCYYIKSVNYIEKE